METKQWGGSADGIVVALVPAAPGVVVKVTGELDAHGAPMLNEALSCALDGEPESVRVDLSACTFIDSSGLSALVRASKQCQERGPAFVLKPVSESVARL